MITLPAHTAKITTMADGSWRVVFDLGELRPDQVGELSKITNKVVCLGITLADSFNKKEKQALKETSKADNSTFAGSGFFD